MKILVTGGAGYIGSHTAVELQSAGYEVIIVDNLSNSNENVLDGIEKISGVRPLFHKVDITDKDLLQRVFDEHEDLTSVIHFAALKAVGESVLDPMLYFRNNILGFINLLDCMNISGVNNIVFSSSCTVYGQADELPVTENSPIKEAESPYGFTKQCGERILSDLAKATELKAIALRYFNPIGAHDTSIIGELPIGVPNNLVPYITQTAAGLREQLTVNGDDYPTPDGTNIRDYIHVVDIAIAHVIAVKRLIDNKLESNPEIFNLGTGHGNSVMEVINTFEKVSGRKLNYRIGPRRQGDVVSVYSDTQKATDILGWKAERDLDNMLLTAWNWQKRISNIED